MIDIIIVGPFDQTTKNCINSIKANSHFENSVTVVPMDDKGYNAALNKGVEWVKEKDTNNAVFAFCNNDLIFNDNWDGILVEEMYLNRCKSGSAWCPKTHAGWWDGKKPNLPQIGTKTGKYLAGWCYVWSHDLYEKLGPFDERQKFWCCDNTVTEMLDKAGERHLLSSAEVTHLGSQMLNTYKGTPRYNELTTQEVKVFNRNYNRNLFNLGC